MTPHGQDPRDVFGRLFRGESAIRMVRSGTPEFRSDLALAPVAFDPGDTIPKLQLLFMARATQMAVVAAHGAIHSAGIIWPTRLPGRGKQILDALKINRFTSVSNCEWQSYILLPPLIVEESNVFFFSRIPVNFTR